MSLDNKITPPLAGATVVTSSAPAAAPVSAPSAAKPMTQPHQQQQQKQKSGGSRKGGAGFNSAPKV